MEYNILAGIGNYAIIACIALFSFASSIGSLYHNLKDKVVERRLEKENHNRLEQKFLGENILN